MYGIMIQGFFCFCLIFIVLSFNMDSGRFPESMHLSLKYTSHEAHLWIVHAKGDHINSLLLNDLFLLKPTFLLILTSLFVLSIADLADAVRFIAKSI